MEGEEEQERGTGERNRREEQERETGESKREREGEERRVACATNPNITCLAERKQNRKP